MLISLSSFKTILPKQLQKIALKNIVREIDETEKGHFVAYVDEGDHSYDVAIVTNDKGEVTSHSCDCILTDPFCRHKTALLIHIAEHKKVKKIIKRKAKAKSSKSEGILQSVSLEELKEWVKGMIQKNPDLELAFTHYFSAQNHNYSLEEIQKLTFDAVKVVIKNKKIADPTQIKKIVDLWSDIHPPMLRSDLTGEDLSMRLHTIIAACFDIQHRLNSSSKKIENYIDGILMQFIEPMAIIRDDGDWEKANLYFVNLLSDSLSTINDIYLKFLDGIISLCSIPRKLTLVEAIVVKYREIKKEMLMHITSFTTEVFDIVVKNELIGKYYKDFSPITWNNNYNLRLFNLLIGINKYELVEKYCNDQIRSNFKEGYNVPYLELLKKIYSMIGNEPGLLQIMEQLIPFTFDFNDYIFVIHHISDESDQKKTFRNLMLSKARLATRARNSLALKFCFQLLDVERNYLKMMEYMDEYAPYELIYEYLESMILSDRYKFLKALARRNECYSWGWHDENEENKKLIYDDFCKVLLKHYTFGELSAIFNKDLVSYRAQGKGLVLYMQSQLRLK